MPTYGYECTQCGHQFEVMQSMSDAALRSCPECMGPLQKMLYPVGVIFKGSGFYTTDYKNAGKDGSKESYNEASKAEREASKAEGSKPEGPKAEGPKSESSKSESSKSEGSKGEGSKGEPSGRADAKPSSGGSDAKSGKPGSQPPAAAAS